MKIQNILLLVCGIVMISYSGRAATCSRANLTRCLDSVCAINVGANPAARCQYCGSDTAGTPPTTAMRSVSAGQSAKYTLTDKELKKAPTDPGSRYAWATTQCVSRVDGCTPDDVTDTYDQLIEQSCRAAGVDAQLTKVRDDMSKKTSKTGCTTSIRSCMTAATRCNYDFSSCPENSDFDKFFSECAVASSGCDPYTAGIKTELVSARETAIANATAVVEGLVKSYQNARETRLASVFANCKNNSLRDGCITSVCSNNMRNHCDADHPAEKSMATQLCKFYEIACDRLK